ncbi:9110_t:CDS:1, partial [Acaulospora morrowiae]
PPEKIVIGMPMYGRTFENTNGLDTPYNGIGSGSFEAGIYDYKVLPREGATEYYDEEYVAGYSYDPKSKEFVTYDTPRVIAEKVKYIKEKNLNGIMFWELSNDLSTGNTRSLLSTAYDSLGGLKNLDDSYNHLNFPSSAYDN